jgi:CheY-like chemotaxis protein
MKADENSLSKSTFLAKMSHEIRTPMNAILGMSELILREKLNTTTRNYADSIRQAGSNLLAIINDILDFSKIESGKMDIINAEYQFSSIINDVIAIIRMRLNEKPIRFIAKIDGSLPAVLIGDEIRVRQVLLNLLTNAVKYTNEGSITFSVNRRNGPEEAVKVHHNGEKQRLLLAFEVADTGIGIKKEDIEKLFGDFTQFDQKQNRGIEGTGLGLVISRNLCLLMGGDITVKSEYGRGSVFTALIPQLIQSDTPVALVEHPETKAALVYDERPLYAESLVYTIETLGVDCIRAHTRDDVIDGLKDRQFIFTSPARLDEVREILRNRNQSGDAGAELSAFAPPTLILLMEDGQTGKPDIQSVFTPLQPVPVANILNGQKSDTGYHGHENLGVRFTAPNARILIVDDIETNLNVAEGLLSPYKMTVDRAAEGLEAVRLVQENQYDLVLMDHMMPGMDGIEATAAIRAWEDKSAPEFSKEVPQASGPKTRLPVIALTANAISGMKEMFLENGFSDYLSKPIEITKLDDMMARWIPAEKRIKAGAEIKRETFSGESSLKIPGVDVKRGINMTGGTEAGYRKVLTQFYKDAVERLDGFKDFFAGEPESRDSGENIAAFTTQVHALKSAAGTIGAAEVSKEAAVLEAAGKSGDVETIRKGMGEFREHLSRLIEGIARVLKEEKDGKPEGGHEVLGVKKQESEDNSLVIREKLGMLRIMLETKNMKEIDKLLTELEAAAGDTKTAETIMGVSDKVLIGEYHEAIKDIDTYITINSGE